MQVPRKLIVQVDSDSGNDARVAYALALAAHFDAAVEGVFAKPAPNIPVIAEGGAGVDVYEMQLEALAQLANRLEEAYREAVDGHEKASWQSIESSWEQALIGRSRAADLIVAAQPSPDDRAATAPRGLAAHVLVGSGRPLLSVPYVGAEPKPPSRIMVAWKDGREAVRAVTDALPFMPEAKVDVVSVNQRSGPVSASAAEIAEWLSAHGIDASSREEVIKEIDVGDYLLSTIADHGTDLLVMGGYSHSRWREVILGGVTRDILDHMTVPVLMSH